MLIISHVERHSAGKKSHVEEIKQVNGNQAGSHDGGEKKNT